AAAQPRLLRHAQEAVSLRFEIGHTADQATRLGEGWICVFVLSVQFSSASRRFVERSRQTLALTETRDQRCNCASYAGETGRTASPGGVSAGRQIICCADRNREQW